MPTARQTVSIDSTEQNINSGPPCSAFQLAFAAMVISQGI